jgi:hypothetical protein
MGSAARSQRPDCSTTTKKCDEFPLLHGFACAKDYIGNEKNITFSG